MGKKTKSAVRLMKNTVKLSFGEEVGNSISHGVPMFLLLFSLPVISVVEWQKHGWSGTIGVGIYLICMILMFGGSCLYHLMPYDTQWKTVFRKLDHISILLAIAGSYTPICLILMNNWIGWTLLAVEWMLALAGILLKSISNQSHPVLSMCLYLLMGWFVLLVFPLIWKQMSLPFLILLASGGVFYTIGTYFYSKKHAYYHFIWHLFILAGAACHFIAIVFYL